MSKPKVVITGTGAVCAAGRTAQEILEAVRAGRSAIGPIRQWDSSGWPTRMAGEIADLNPREMVEDRKLHKLIRRTDLFGLYAAARVIDAAGLAAYRDTLAPEAAAQYNDRTGVYVGSGGGNYDSQYDYFPLMTEAKDALPAFGRELANTVNPMWLLRTLPNNVLGHIGIRHGFKGSNACITNHSIGGTLAVIEATEALRNGEADRALAVGHDAPIEPQMVLYYTDVGLIASEMIRPFDHRHDGSLFGEGGAALALETEASAAARGATVLGDVLGGGSASDAQGLLAIRDDGDALARAIALALDDAGLSPGDVGMIAAHGNGTPQSDASEALAIRRIFGANGASVPPTTAFKWAFGHLIAAAGILDAVLALHALREDVVPGVATFESLDAVCEGVPVSREPQRPVSDVALILCRGFAGTNAALLLRASR
ncbi:MAG TPA: beta-ketoacyl synthase N-terminal-like domain-containing protein [Casimicrobiaceae bacterium]|nr:beta-ketoacyl synthase N-terminal-like domain-containing protein [Casimicrobiaceae bacterium]